MPRWGSASPSFWTSARARRDTFSGRAGSAGTPGRRTAAAGARTARPCRRSRRSPRRWRGCRGAAAHAVTQLVADRRRPPASRDLVDHEARVERRAWPRAAARPPVRAPPARPRRSRSSGVRIPQGFFWSSALIHDLAHAPRSSAGCAQPPVQRALDEAVARSRSTWAPGTTASSADVRDRGRSRGC